MAGLFLQAFSLSLVLVLANGNGNTFCHTKPDAPFAFYYFVQQWPGALRTKGCCYSEEQPLPGRYFRPHGLWPAYVDGTSPCYCEQGSNGDVNGRLGTELQEEMVIYWGSISCPPQNPSKFPDYQWRKHGSCTGMRKDEYFQRVMDLYFRYDLAAAFRAAGIFPDWRLYTLKDLKMAVVKVSGKVPIITCTFNFEHKVRQLSEIFICLDKDMKAFHCPTPKFTLCTGAPIIFPDFDPSYDEKPTHRFQPRLPDGRPRKFHKPHAHDVASNRAVAFEPASSKPTTPLAALCMDPSHSEIPHRGAVTAQDFDPSYDEKPTYRFQPRLPDGRPRKFHKPHAHDVASNRAVAFEPATSKPTTPLAALCMDPFHSEIPYSEQGYSINQMACPFVNSSLNLKPEPTRIYVP